MFQPVYYFYCDFRDEISKLKSEYEAAISDLEDDIKLLQQTVSAKDKAIEAYKAMAANSATNFGSQVIHYNNTICNNFEGQFNNE